jgi:cellulose synthase/poly-beta-1,6-N-acetylglucosamine synthase-like glycosyltransferase
MFILNAVYTTISLVLAVYLCNALALLMIFVFGHFRRRQRRPPALELLPPEWPKVTVQLPVYNEAHVIGRLIRAACNLDYAQDRLQIQVVDDSTDDTTAFAMHLVTQYQARGYDIALVHRTHRTGFKGGALREALKTASGQFIAIFDADFVPPGDFLKSLMPHFHRNPRLGMVQSRWGHLNREYSAHTRAQAMGIDAHFTVEQTTRSSAGLFMNFNGSGGVWRKECILDAGNWQDDTICEDLDLSFRAQLRDWRFLYVPDVVSPAELPAQVAAFKRQQFRWAKGSVQCALKLWRSVVQAPVGLFKRLSALLHLTGYLMHVLLVAGLIILVPLLFWDVRPVHVLAVFAGLTIVHPSMLLASQATLYPDWKRRMVYLPILVLLCTGLAVNSMLAIWEAVTHSNSTFLRTPKFDLNGRQGKWHTSRYVLPLDKTLVLELCLGGYALLGVLVAWWRGNLGAAFFIAIYAASFLYIALAQLVQSLRCADVPVSAVWQTLLHSKKHMSEGYPHPD